MKDTSEIWNVSRMRFNADDFISCISSVIVAPRVQRFFALQNRERTEKEGERERKRERERRKGGGRGKRTLHIVIDVDFAEPRCRRLNLIICSSLEFLRLNSCLVNSFHVARYDSTSEISGERRCTPVDLDHDRPALISQRNIVDHRTRKNFSFFFFLFFFFV